MRDLCCVLLRRVIGTTEQSLWPVLSAQTQGITKSQLLEALEKETNNHTRSQLTNAVSELGKRLLDPKLGGSSWNELLAFMHKATKSPKEGDREAALHIFGDLADELQEQLRPQLGMLKDILAAGLGDPASLKVRLAALNAVISFLSVLNQPSERAVFQELTQLMLATISAALQSNQEEEARTAIEMFVDIAEYEPSFFRANLQPVVSAMITIASAAGLENSTRHLGLEFLLTLTEVKPAMLRKFPKFVETVVPVVIGMMLELEDDPDWHTGNDQDDDDHDPENSNSDMGEEALDRLALSLGGTVLVPFLFQILPGLMSHADWQHRHTALMCISIAGEGCHKQLLPHLESIIRSVLPFFQDPHPRVRWAACNTAGQMSTDFTPQLQNKFHAQVLPALIGLMDDAANPRVQSHAASAVINFCEGCTPDILAPYLDSLLRKLFSLLQIRKVLVMEQAITAIAAVADCAANVFVNYYDTFMPLLRDILTNFNGKEYRTLRGKTMECISLIGGAVGKEKFYQDAKDVMELMMRTQSSQLDPDDPQISFLLQSWARICRCMGPDFVPYLGYVMPPLLQSASINPDINVVEEGEGQEGWDFIPVGDKRIGINTSALEEKSTACNMLYCYASELKEGFFPYVDQVTKLLVPLMRFYYHDGVRSAAFSTTPHLLQSAALYFQKAGAAAGADTTYVRNLLVFTLATMYEALLEEMDMEVLQLGLEALAECIETGGEGALNGEQLSKSTEVLVMLFSDVASRRNERAARKKEEDHDDEEEERLNVEDEQDENVLGYLGDVIGRLLKTHKEQFLPLFQQHLLPIVTAMLNSPKESDVQVALCVFCDMVEHLHTGAGPFFPTFVPVMMNAIVSTNPALRQAAAFGAGLCAQYGGSQIAPAIPEILNRLVAAIKSPEAKSEAFACPTDNAVSAVGKVAQFSGAVVDVAQVLTFWFSCLPVTDDTTESKVTYNQLCTFIEAHNPHVFGQNYSNVGKIVSIFAEVLGTELVDDELTQRMSVLLKQLVTQMPQAFASLPAEQQQKLSQYTK